MLWIPLIAGFAIVLAIMQVQLRSVVPEWGVLLSSAFMVVMMLALLPQLAEMIGVLTALADDAQVGSMYLAPVLKTIAVAYIVSIGAQISRDANENTIAAVVELAGKVVIVLVALPVIQAILYSLLGMLG